MKSSSNKKPIRVHFLNGDSTLLVFDSKTYVKKIVDKVCSLRSIKETQFFGLSRAVENESFFLDEKEKLSKYAPKNSGRTFWKKDGVTQEKPASILVVTLEVQFFVEHPKLINDADSRHYYYLHLKKNFLRSTALARDETVFTLAATALHIDFGTFDESVHTGSYFRPMEYMPQWFLRKWGESYLKTHLPKMHAELSPSLVHHARADFIEKASIIDDIPVHNYRLFKNKTEKCPSVVLGVSGRGIRLQHLAQPCVNGHKLLDLDFPWSKIGRFLFAAKRFEIYPNDLPSSRKLIYYTGNNAKSKYLLRLLKNTHSLHLSLTSFVQHLRNPNGIQEKKNYRESYIAGLGTMKKIVGASRQEQKNEKAVSMDFTESYRFRKSIMSKRSSITSGIESDERQQGDDMNATNTSVYGFESNEALSSDSVICITDEHLKAPPSKNLSVSNLLDAILKEIGNPVEDHHEKRFSLSKNLSLQEPRSMKKDSDLFSSDYFLTNTLQPRIFNYSKEPLTIKQRPLTADNKKYKSKQDFGKPSNLLRRESSGISEILNLLPDVPGLEVAKIGSNTIDLKLASQDQAKDVFPYLKKNDPHPLSKTGKISTPETLLNDSHSKHLRSNSAGVDSLFDYDPSEMMTTLQLDQSIQDDPKVEESYCNFDDLDYLSNANQIIPRHSVNPATALKPLNESSVSEQKSFFESSVFIQKAKVKDDPPKTSCLLRSEKQKNIPFTFQNRQENKFSSANSKKDHGQIAARKEPQKHSSMVVSHREMNNIMKDQAGFDWTCSPRAVDIHRHKSQEMYSKHFSKFLLRDNSIENKSTIDRKSQVTLRPKCAKKDRSRARPRPLSHNVTLRSNADKNRQNCQSTAKSKRPNSAPRSSTSVDTTEILV